MKYLSPLMRSSDYLRSGRPVVIAALLAALVPSCAVDVDGDLAYEVETDLENLYSASEAMVAFQVDDQTTVTFYSGEDGVIAIGEIAPGDAPSPLSYLAGAKRATPLEIFLSLADHAVEAPVALLEDHTRRVHAESADSNARLAAQPRTFPLPDPAQESACNWGNCDEGTNWYYAANCSLASDGSYFDNKWASWGFNYHWYKSLYTDNIGWYYGYPEKSPTLYYNKFFSHLCNYTTYDYPINHFVYWGGGATQWMGAQVYQGHRHVLHLYNASGGTHASAGYPNYGDNGNFKIGVMAGN